jgi:hypothetical protein
MSTKNLVNRATCLHRSQYWLHAILVQSERILIQSERINECTNFTSASDRNPDPEAISKLLDTQAMDSHFFVIAIKHSIDWLNELKRFDESLRGEINTFIKCVSKAEQLRNMLEHQDRYLKGNGKNRDKFWQDVRAQNGSVLAKNIAPFTNVFTDEGLQIGGLVSLNETVRAAKVLREHIVRSSTD